MKYVSLCLPRENDVSGTLEPIDHSMSRHAGKHGRLISKAEALDELDLRRPIVVVVDDTRLMELLASRQPAEETGIRVACDVDTVSCARVELDGLAWDQSKSRCSRVEHHAGAAAQTADGMPAVAALARVGLGIVRVEALPARPTVAVVFEHQPRRHESCIVLNNGRLQRMFRRRR